MQLFVTEYQKKGNSVTISNPDLLSQIRKVLRASIGDSIRIQSPKNEAKKIRYEVHIAAWNDKTLEGTVVSEQSYDNFQKKRNMIVSMPNKWDKVELIVQKLTECGLDQIFFRPSERSIIKEWNEKKEERIHKIIKEAVEQSRGWTIPELSFTTNPKAIVGKHPLVIFDKETGTGKLKTSDTMYGLIGPEGGLTYKDYQTFAGTSYDTYGLGETILRTETAAIIGGRLMKNNI